MCQKMYTTLFNAITDAPELPEVHEFEAAHLRLMSAQRETEQICISGADEGPSERRL